MNGIDVAKWQGNINWAQVKASGKVDFAILKVTQKDNAVEGAFECNYNGCIANNIPVGVYRYVYAANVAQAQVEANAIVRCLSGKTIKCGVWLDMEDSSIAGIGKANLTAIINAEMRILNAAGYEVGIYCNKNWHDKILDSAALKNSYPFWIARYPSSDTGVQVASLSPVSYAQAWQYSSKGSVSGISGNVDMDVSFIDLVDRMSRVTGSTVATTATEYPYVGRCTGNGVRVRDGAGRECKELRQLNAGNLVEVLGTSPSATDGLNWYWVNVTGLRGYVHPDYIVRN